MPLRGWRTGGEPRAVVEVDVGMSHSMVVRTVATVLALLCSSTASAGPFDNAVGSWWGQAEYIAKVNAVPDPAAQAVVDLTVTVEAGGKIFGESPANGCELSGVLTPGSTPQNYRSQVTVSGCRAGNLNGRWMGPISVKPQAGTLAISLQLVEPGSRPSRWGTIRVTMVRR